MRLVRLALLALGIALVGCAGGCKRKTRATSHPSGEAQASSALVPTPDNTPIEVLRTPAGLILKPGPESTATPAPSAGGAPPSAKAPS